MFIVIQHVTFSIDSVSVLTAILQVNLS